ncbi:MAG: hypothetical protein KF892_23575 [Rhizobacter sp.]|nr:hypothetical protein [Rhizobacter sp.]
MAEDAAERSLLERAARSTLRSNFDKAKAEDAKSGRSWQCKDSCQGEIEAATQETISCYNKRVTRYTTNDRLSFAQLVSEYPDAFDIPDWEARLTNVLDSRYGSGATASRKNCSPPTADSQECSVKKSYEAVGGLLYWEFAACAVSSVNAQQAKAKPARPNPSIERTSPGKPGAASHVKR